MPTKENFHEGSDSQTISEVLTKNFSKLTLSPIIQLAPSPPGYPHKQLTEKTNLMGLLSANSTRKDTINHSERKDGDDDVT